MTFVGRRSASSSEAACSFQITRGWRCSAGSGVQRRSAGDDLSSFSFALDGAANDGGSAVVGACSRRWAALLPLASLSSRVLPFASVSKTLAPTAGPTTRAAVAPGAPRIVVLSVFIDAAIRHAFDDRFSAERHRLIKVTGDGKCMFRSLALGLSAELGKSVGPADEEKDADALRMAVAESLCTKAVERQKYPEAMTAIEAEGGLHGYCRKIVQPTFWGGEVELLVLSKLLAVPIVVYLPENQVRQSALGGFGYVPIQRYGGTYGKDGTWAAGMRKPVKLVYNGANHYDLLL